jgi:hypothetical protein
MDDLNDREVTSENAAAPNEMLSQHIPIFCQLQSNWVIYYMPAILNMVYIYIYRISKVQRSTKNSLFYGLT